MNNDDSPILSRATTPTILHDIENDKEGGFERAAATGVGRRAMREMMDLKRPDGSTFTSPTAHGGRATAHKGNDREKVNFVRMLLAVKMSKNDGACHQVQPGLFIGSIGAAWNR